MITPQQEVNSLKSTKQQKQQKIFKLEHYQIIVIPKTDRTLSIKVIDYQMKIQFAQSQLTLEQIGTSTILLGLEGKSKVVIITPKYKKQGEFEILQLHLKVESFFLKTIEETIYIKKQRNINEAEVLEKKINSISIKLKKIKHINKQKIKGFNLCNIKPEEQSFNGAGYENLISLTLPKGNYVLTFSFLLKANNAWIYIYLNQGEAVIYNSGYYIASTSAWIPYTVRKVYNVEQESKQISFTTNAANSYPISMKNRIITARLINQNKQ